MYNVFRPWCRVDPRVRSPDAPNGRHVFEGYHIPAMGFPRPVPLCFCVPRPYRVSNSRLACQDSRQSPWTLTISFFHLFGNKLSFPCRSNSNWCAQRRTHLQFIRIQVVKTYSQLPEPWISRIARFTIACQLSSVLRCSLFQWTWISFD
jgi:hypothetical protein